MSKSGIPAKVFDIDLLSIIVDSSIQPRANTLDQSHVEDLKEAYLAKADIPPITVWKLPNGHNKLSQGFHRLEAANRAGMQKIPAIIKVGTEKDCLIDAMCSNQGHGLKRTNEDKRRCVTELLKAMPEWSDGLISQKAGVSQQFVSKIRPSVLHSDNSSHNSFERGGKNVGTFAIDFDAQPDEQTEVTAEKPAAKPAKVRTGKDGISRKVPERSSPASKPTKPPEPVSLEPEDVQQEEQPYSELEESDDFDSECDALGEPLPRAVRDTFGDVTLKNAVERIRKAHAELVSIENHIRNSVAPKAGYWPYAHTSKSLESMKAATDLVAVSMSQLESGLPYCVCPKCPIRGEGCQHCRQSGCWPKWKHEGRENYGV